MMERSERVRKFDVEHTGRHDTVRKGIALTHPLECLWTQNSSRHCAGEGIALTLPHSGFVAVGSTVGAEWSGWRRGRMAVEANRAGRRRGGGLDIRAEDEMNLSQAVKYLRHFSRFGVNGRSHA